MREMTIFHQLSFGDSFSSLAGRLKTSAEGTLSFIANLTESLPKPFFFTPFTITGFEFSIWKQHPLSEECPEDDLKLQSRLLVTLLVEPYLEGAYGGSTCPSVFMPCQGSLRSLLPAVSPVCTLIHSSPVLA
jgi:hypothetical protein